MDTPKEEQPKKEEKQPEPPSVRREVFKRTVDLATAAFGLVAALAWNDAVRALFERIFGTEGGGIVAKFGYAIIVTVVVVIVSVRLQRAAAER